MAVKAIPILNYVINQYGMKACIYIYTYIYIYIERERGGVIDPPSLTLELCAGVVSFTPRPLHPRACRAV
jgi:hypothetical protein